MNLIINLISAIFIISLPFRDTLQIGTFGSVSFIAGLMLLILTLIFLLKYDLKLLKNIVYPSLALFIGLCLSCIFSFMSGFQLNVNYLSSYLMYILLFNLYFHLFLYIPNFFLNTIIFIIISGGIVSIFAIYAFGLDFDTAIILGSSEYRAQGGFRNPSYLALFSLVTFFTGINFIKTYKFSFLKILLSLLIIFSFIGFLIALMRSAYLTFAVVFTLFLYKNLKENRQSKRIKFIFYTSVILTSIIFLVYYFKFDLFISDRLLQLESIYRGTDSSTLKRSSTMLGALQIFFENPLSGVGLGNLSEYIHKSGLFFRQNSAENTYLQFIAETGLIGTASFLIFYNNLRRNNYRKLKVTNYLKNKTLSRNIFYEPIIIILLMSLFDNNVKELIIYICFAGYVYYKQDISL